MSAPDINRLDVEIIEETRGARSMRLASVRTHWQLVRFLAVGGVNTLFGYSVFFLLTWLGVRYPLAIGLATIAGVAFNFQSVGRLVFGGAPRSSFWRFVAVYCFIYLLNLGGVHVLLKEGANIYVANAIILLPLSLLAFLLNRRYVFSRS